MAPLPFDVAPSTSRMASPEVWTVRRAIAAGETLRPRPAPIDAAAPATNGAPPAPAPAGVVVALVCGRERAEAVYCKRTRETVRRARVRVEDDTAGGLRVVLWRAHADADVGARARSIDPARAPRRSATLPRKTPSIGAARWEKHDPPVSKCWHPPGTELDRGPKKIQKIPSSQNPRPRLPPSRRRGRRRRDPRVPRAVERLRSLAGAHLRGAPLPRPRPRDGERRPLLEPRRRKKKPSLDAEREPGRNPRRRRRRAPLEGLGVGARGPRARPPKRRRRRRRRRRRLHRLRLRVRRAEDSFDERSFSSSALRRGGGVAHRAAEDLAGARSAHFLGRVVSATTIASGAAAEDAGDDASEEEASSSDGAGLRSGARPRKRGGGGEGFLSSSPGSSSPPRVLSPPETSPGSPPVLPRFRRPRLWLSQGPGARVEATLPAMPAAEAVRAARVLEGEVVELRHFRVWRRFSSGRYCLVAPDVVEPGAPASEGRGRHLGPGQGPAAEPAVAPAAPPRQSDVAIGVAGRPPRRRDRVAVSLLPRRRARRLRAGGVRGADEPRRRLRAVSGERRVGAPAGPPGYTF